MTDFVYGVQIVVLAIISVPTILVLVSGWDTSINYRTLFSRRAAIVLPITVVVVALVAAGLAPAFGIDVGFMLVWVPLALVVVATVRWLLRRFLFDRWRNGQLSHEKTAAVVTFLGPAGIALALLAATGNASLPVVAAGLVALALAYRFAVLILRWLAGEYDPPSSSGYRRRP